MSDEMALARKAMAGIPLLEGFFRDRLHGSAG